MFSVFKWVGKNESKFGNWASIVALVLFIIGIAVDHVFANTPHEWIYALGYLILVFSCIMFLALRYRQIGRNAKYADIVPYLREATKVVAVECTDEHPSLDSGIRTITGVLDQVALAFTAIAGTKCRSCIKTVDVPEKDALNQHLQVKVLRRDSQSHRPTPPGTVQITDGPQMIESNTDFSVLWNDPLRLWFFGYDLPELARQGDYRNSNVNWAKSYRSSLVWPIQRMNDVGRSELVAYLCVDCRRIGAFNEYLDYDVGAIFADILYPLLKRLQFIESHAAVPGTQRLTAGSTT